MYFLRDLLDQEDEEQSGFRIGNLLETDQQQTYDTIPVTIKDRKQTFSKFYSS